MTKSRLTNKSRIAQTFNVPWQNCGAQAAVRQVRGKVTRTSEGHKRVAPERLQLSTSITLRGKGKEGSSITVPTEFLEAPEIKAALAQKTLIAQPEKLAAQADKAAEEKAAAAKAAIEAKRKSASTTAPAAPAPANEQSNEQSNERESTDSDSTQTRRKKAGSAGGN